MEIVDICVTYRLFLELIPSSCRVDYCLVRYFWDKFRYAARSVEVLDPLKIWGIEETEPVNMS